jgi:hypothetical protein
LCSIITYSMTNKQVIFTGSRDKTIEEWNLRTGGVERGLRWRSYGECLELVR